MLSLPNGAIAYYLRHQECIGTYLKQAEAEEAIIVEQLRHRKWALARGSVGDLSPDEETLFQALAALYM